jgi:hypothetical protein
MDLYPLFDTLEMTAVGVAIRESIWLFPVIEAVHLLALATLGGAALMLDLRLLGLGLKGHSPAMLEKSARPYLFGAILMLIATGVPLALSEALKLYGKPAFWLKMSTLLVALIFLFAVRNPLARRDPEGGLAPKLVGLISLSLWLVVAAAGRWIGFS